MIKKKNLIKIILIALIVIIIALGVCILYNKVIKKDNKDNKKSSYVSKQGIVGFGTIEKQNKTSDEEIDIVAYYKNGTIKKIYSFDSDYLKEFISEGNVMYETKNINIDYDDDKLYVQIDKRLYYIDLKAKEYELIDLGIDFYETAEKLYVIDGIAYLNYSSHPSKIYNIEKKELKELEVDSYDSTNFFIDKKSKSIIFTDKYDFEASVKQNLYFAPLSDLHKQTKIYSSTYNNIDLIGAYNGKAIYTYYTEAFTTKYAIYDISKTKTKKTDLKGALTMYPVGKDLYYTDQEVQTKEDSTLNGCTLKLYKYGKSKPIYQFNNCTEGNFANYIGNNLFEMVDSGKPENNVIVDTEGKVKDLYITDKSNNKEKLDVTKYYKINYEYVEVN